VAGVPAGALPVPFFFSPSPLLPLSLTNELCSWSIIIIKKIKKSKHHEACRPASYYHLSKHTHKTNLGFTCSAKRSISSVSSDKEKEKSKNSL
jgi:hypothetical protein